MCLAEDIGAMIYYTDTDSMHIDEDYVRGENESLLGKAFREKYGHDLIGKNLGQFHTDFDFGGSYSIVDGELVPCTTKSVGDILAAESIFLGKKSYLDLLQDEEGNKAYHIRLKGIPAKCIMHKCNTEYKGDAMSLYKDLFKGKPVTFDLNAGGAIMFKTHKNHTISTVSMTRTVKFKSGVMHEVM